MKKKIIIVIASVATLLVAANVFAYVNYNKIESYMNELDISRKKIVLLDEFRNDIVKASQFERLYILTGKESYRNDFKNSITTIINQVNNYYNKGYITEDEKTKLLATIDSFDNYSINSSNNIETNSISSNVENKIVNYNKNQLDILHQITLDISSEDTASSKKNNQVTSFSSIQTKLIQGVSTVLTILGSGIGLYFKKKLNKQNIDIDDVINYLTNNEDNKPTNNSLNYDNIEDLKTKVSQNEVLLSNAKLLYTQSIKFKSQCEKSENLLLEIDLYIEKLKNTLEIIEDYPTSAQNIILEDIEKQLVEFKILFKTLPNYNEFISEISKNMINK